MYEILSWLWECRWRRNWDDLWTAPYTNHKCFDRSSETIKHVFLFVECEAEWSSFGDHCYMNLNNSGQHYNDIEVCRWVGISRLCSFRFQISWILSGVNVLLWEGPLQAFTAKRRMISSSIWSSLTGLTTDLRFWEQHWSRAFLNGMTTLPGAMKTGT